MEAKYLVYIRLERRGKSRSRHSPKISKLCVRTRLCMHICVCVQKKSMGSLIRSRQVETDREVCKPRPTVLYNYRRDQSNKVK